jgi:hypothetical protein
MPERCPVCSRINTVNAVLCDCGSPFGQELAIVPGPLGHRLVRAWLSLGCGGVILLVACAVALGQMTWFAPLVGLGGLLVLRGGRVVSRTGVNILDAAAQAALPPARVVPQRPRADG